METLIFTVAPCLGLGAIFLASRFGLTKDWERIFLHIYFFLRRRSRAREISAQAPSRGPRILRPGRRVDRPEIKPRFSPRTAPRSGASFRPRTRVPTLGTKTYNTVPRLFRENLQWTCECRLCKQNILTRRLTVGCHKCGRPRTRVTVK